MGRQCSTWQRLGTRWAHQRQSSQWAPQARRPQQARRSSTAGIHAWAVLAAVQRSLQLTVSSRAQLRLALHSLVLTGPSSRWRLLARPCPPTRCGQWAGRLSQERLQLCPALQQQPLARLRKLPLAALASSQSPALQRGQHSQSRQLRTCVGRQSAVPGCCPTVAVQPSLISSVQQAGR